MKYLFNHRISSYFLYRYNINDKNDLNFLFCWIEVHNTVAQIEHGSRKTWVWGEVLNFWLSLDNNLVVVGFIIDYWKSLECNILISWGRGSGNYRRLWWGLERRVTDNKRLIAGSYVEVSKSSGGRRSSKLKSSSASMKSQGVSSLNVTGACSATTKFAATVDVAGFCAVIGACASMPVLIW